VIRALNHVSITTGDLDRSLDFYESVLALPLLGRGETDADHLAPITGFPAVRLRWAELDLGGGQILELFQYVVPAGAPLTQRTCDPGSVHIAFETDNLDDTYLRLRAAGVLTRSAPVTIDTGDWADAKSLYAVDPDGVTVELVELPASRKRRQA
jgi:catechol 2,3-dioxygenase-like lactoylglutathione lyase family enzyme